MLHAIVRNGVVETVVDAAGAFPIPEGAEAHPVETPCGAGWLWNDGEPSPSVSTLLSLKASKLEGVRLAYEAAITAGVSYGGKVYQIDQESIARITGRALYAKLCLDGDAEWPEDFGWIATDNTRPLFTAAQFVEFAMWAQGRLTTVTLRARDLKDEVLAAVTLEQIAAIDPTTGWD